MSTVPIYNGTNTTKSVDLSAGLGTFGGIFVSSASNTPTITVYDGTDNTGIKVIDTFTPVSATWYKMPFEYKTGLYVAIGGTVSCTLFWL